MDIIRRGNEMGERNEAPTTISWAGGEYARNSLAGVAGEGQDTGGAWRRVMPSVGRSRHA